MSNIGRFEYKYLLPVARREELLEIAAPYVLPDEHATLLANGSRGYEVHSLYFDTFRSHRNPHQGPDGSVEHQPLLGDYRDRLAERQIRDRLRARTYGQPGTVQPVFLENKRKLMERVVKHRARICTADEWNAVGGETPWRAFAAKLKPSHRFGYENFDHKIVGMGRRPVSIVHYVREVYVARDPDQPKVRLTLDCEVCATTRPASLDLYAPPDVDLIPRDWMVLELKFDGDRPGWMRRICAALQLRACPISKFGLSVTLGWRASEAAELRYFTPQPLRQRGWFVRPGMPLYLEDPRPERRIAQPAEAAS